MSPSTFRCTTAVLAVCLVACATPKEPPPQGEGSFARGDFDLTPDAPSPTACAADEECVADTVLDGRGCCVDTPIPVAQSQAYRTWANAQKARTGCAAVKCPTILPDRPLDCQLRASCRTGRCTNECSR